MLARTQHKELSEVVQRQATNEFEPHRNIFEGNTILENGAGIVVRGRPQGLVFHDNALTK